MSAVAGWDHSDLVEAVASVVADSEQCSTCGLTEDQGWWVAAELDTCPTCADRDALFDQLPSGPARWGKRVRFTQLTSWVDSIRRSSTSLRTPEGRRKYREWQRDNLGSKP